VDTEFFRFVTRLPKLVENYQRNSLSTYAETSQKLEVRIKQNYWFYYEKFMDVFGLKLNYSMREERGTNEVKLVKRLDRKWFKQEKQRRGSQLAEIDEFVENEKELDRSFISNFEDDQLNRSFLSNTTSGLHNTLSIPLTGGVLKLDNTIGSDKDLVASKTSAVNPQKYFLNDISAIDHTHDDLSLANEEHSKQDLFDHFDNA